MAQNPNDEVTKLAAAQPRVLEPGDPTRVSEQTVKDSLSDDGVATSVESKKDHRVRISAFTGQEDEVYGPSDTSNLMFPLRVTGGLMFPYTPSISVAQDTAYTVSDLEHSNFDILSYQKSSSVKLSVSAKFTAQNQREAEYMIAVIHFLRTVSKTYFGKSDSSAFKEIADDTDTTTVKKVREDGKAGLPPPVLTFSGYGEMMFNHIKVVVNNYSFTFDENMDMMPVILRNGTVVYLPPVLQISIGLGVQTNPDEMRENFSLASFKTGELLKDKRGWF